MDNLRDHIRKLREDFSHGKLDETDVDRDPAKQFTIWIDQAVQGQVHEVQAMILATCGKNGMPSSRVVYLREFHDNEYAFYTNYNSRKMRELNENPQASCTFFWPQLERQIRIEGTVVKAPAEQSDNYFGNRPYESQLGAWASQQSAELKSRTELEERVAELKKKHPPGSVKRPEFWGGMILKATYYEFWQGRQSRLHDRLSYTLNNGAWMIKRLSP